MAVGALRFCTEPGCSAKVNEGRCPAHLKAYRQHVSRFLRGSLSYGRPWRRAIEAWKAEDEARLFCAQCRADGRQRLADVVDHILPHRGDANLFWDRDNWQALCAECHNRKTARESWVIG